jgi:hypothetical protein
LIAVSFWLWYAGSLERCFELKVALESGSECGGENTISSLEKTQTDGGQIKYKVLTKP